MQTVLALEFDALRFPTSQSCLDWLKQSDYDYLLQTRGFRLRLRKKCIYLKGESRKVFTFYKNLWKYANQLLERPEPHVVVVKKTGTQAFQSVDLPEDLPSTVEREEKKAEKRALREEKEAERREKRKQKRKRAKTEKDGKATKKKAKTAAEADWVNNPEAPLFAAETAPKPKKKTKAQLQRDRAEVEKGLEMSDTQEMDMLGDFPDPPKLVRESPVCYSRDVE